MNLVVLESSVWDGSIHRVTFLFSLSLGSNSFSRQTMVESLEVDTAVIFVYAGFERIWFRGKILWMQILNFIYFEARYSGLLSKTSLFPGSSCGHLAQYWHDGCTFSRFQLWSFYAKLAQRMSTNSSDSDASDLYSGHYFFGVQKKYLWAGKSLFMNLHVVYDTHVYYLV